MTDVRRRANSIALEHSRRNSVGQRLADFAVCPSQIRAMVTRVYRLSGCNLETVISRKHNFLTVRPTNDFFLWVFQDLMYNDALSALVLSPISST